MYVYYINSVKLKKNCLKLNFDLGDSFFEMLGQIENVMINGKKMVLADELNQSNIAPSF